MKKQILLLSLLSLNVKEACAEFSMMLNKSEQKALQQFEQKPSCDNILYLSGILHLSPKQWTIWVNGQTISAEQPSTTFEICAVKSDSVEIAYKDKKFVLKTNQTINLQNGQVFTGDKRQELSSVSDTTDDFDF